MAAEDRGTEWEGYSDYQAVSRSVANSIDDAIYAYAWLQRLHREGATVRPGAAADASADIMAAALRVLVEMREEQERGNGEYDEILERWTGDEDDDDASGYIAEIHEAELQEGIPGWMYQFVTDIRTAGFKLGYLQAGRRTKKDPDNPVQAQAEDMIRGA